MPCKSSFNRSDAYIYLHKAWYPAFIEPDGGFAGTLVPMSPYVWVQTQAYRLLGPHGSVPFPVNPLLMSLGMTFSALTARRLFGARASWAAEALGALCGPLVFFAGLTVKTNLVVPVLAAGGSSDITPAEQRFFSPVGLNFYVGNAPGARGSYTAPDGVKDDLIGHHTDVVEVAEKAPGRTLTRGEVSRYWLARSLGYYTQHPGEYLVLQLRKAGMMVAQAARGLPEQYRVWRW